MIPIDSSDVCLQELQGLKGWKAAVSLILEALDFAAPLVMQIGRKGSAAISWLLVALIGRSLGLIFRGVKQSLGMGPKQKPRESDRPNSFGYT